MLLAQKWCEWFYNKDDSDKELESELVDGVYFLGTKLTLPYNNVRFNAEHKIPRDSSILVNCGKWTAMGLPFISKEKDLLELATKRMDSLDSYQVLLDNKPITPIRMTSKMFNLKVNRNIEGHTDPVLGYMPEIKKGKYNAVIDGYWLHFKPEQDCTISSFTSCKTGILSLNVNHSISLN